jgi:hypothetical protein
VNFASGRSAWIKSRTALKRLALPNVIPVRLDELEATDPALAGVKGDRTAVEYLPPFPRQGQVRRSDRIDGRQLERGDQWE